MLTYSGIMLSTQEVNQFLKQTAFKKWPFFLKPNNDPMRIVMPHLNTRERLNLDSMLPRCSAKQILKRIGYWCADTKEESLEALQSYALFYRYYPYFSRIVP